ncbi:phosphoribosylanthranilate isomerase [Lentilactobacillus buchneri]|uniref:N-(5'-phosphoribosyl)anthranilate isomerase n=1 Tax=Lentilactobacillus buchneri subsp. silagei CD034 TaxID=1071400 RepID=J9W478_LENBU|nr:MULTISPECIES: phosphoribosylanthranilate isomerase [Lentilactobacillus]MCC6101849.1 phosphoribosylanthranilate isomerase [Lactobacillus sp.]AFS01283.1 N-(5'-phosphoribosyl)anthranilate isomerase [Lentilactobacillus buchneri subsp. silagei CD034]MCT2901008.1 phosphoribosylanthranilate isomerase [Lentilactobacillus buchneri]MCT3542757.1 phosphoribosylanthranilate isomerase [Lentilactobacillus buchneri]MCT3545899.1 phosphoribosylanthranilate isomerase [Lentilactobacillus buchneri]
MVKVKICGLMEPADIQAVNEAQADFAGFVFAKSRHVVSLATALALQTHLNPNIQKVGVFVNESIADILAIYQAGAIDIAQLHGKSTPEEIAELQRAGLKVIQVFERQAIDPKSTADYLMVDSGKGSGQSLNWQAVPHVDRTMILAGGLTPDNISQAIQIVQPDIVDVSSGVESDGKKDPNKIMNFIKNAKEEYVL